MSETITREQYLDAVAKPKRTENAEIRRRTA